MKTRQIIRLRAEDGNGTEERVETYQIGAGMGEDPNPGKIVQRIDTYGPEENGGASIDFANGTRRIIPECRIISLDLSREAEG